jgi:hypothetical protein
MKAKVKLIVSEPPARRLHVQTAYYKQARQFEIAMRLLIKANHENAVSLPREFFVAVPMVVCHSFAAELFLKCLLLIEGKQARGHHLGELFDALSPDHRSRIQQRYSSTETRPPHDTWMVREVLTRNGDAFTEWRYLNEGTPNPQSAMYITALVLPSIKEIIWQEVPSLKQVLPYE